MTAKKLHTSRNEYCQQRTNFKHTVGNIYRKRSSVPPKCPLSISLKPLLGGKQNGIGVLQRAPDSGWPWLRPFGRAQVCKVWIYNLTHLQNRPLYFILASTFSALHCCVSDVVKTLGNPAKAMFKPGIQLQIKPCQAALSCLMILMILVALFLCASKLVSG